MGGRSNSILRSYPFGVIACTPHPYDTTAYRQEGSHDYDAIRTSRQNHDEILQIPHR
jgi:hypothetical protein